MSLGAFPIINYYAETPIIERAVYIEDTVALLLSWSGVAHADQYRIYISGEKNGGYGFTDVTPEVDSFLPNSLTATIPLVGSLNTPLIQLTPADKIYVYIAPLRNGHEWPASEIAAIDLTHNSNSINLLLSASITSAPNFTFDLNAEIIEG
jgi:hypothetical protein